MGRTLFVYDLEVGLQPTQNQPTQEIHSMRELRGVVESWRRQHTGIAWGKLDIKEMFPNIARDEVEPAVNFFFFTQIAGKVPNPALLF